MGAGESGNGKGETRDVMRRRAVRRFPFPASRFPALHGEGGIRTPDRGISPYNGLANRRLQPLGHLSSRCGSSQFTDASATPTSWIELATDKSLRRNNERPVLPTHVNGREIGDRRVGTDEARCREHGSER